MNDLLKLLSNGLKPFGYHIRKYSAPNVLSLPKFEKEHPSLKSLKNNQYGQYKTDNANLDHMIVFLRVCMRENRNINAKPRIFGSDIKEGTLRCVNSLITAMENAKSHGQIKLIVLDDHSDDSCLTDLKQVLGKASFDVEVLQTSQTGQGASLHEQFMRGKNENALLYFVEDDYLHEPGGLDACWAFYKQAYEDFDTHTLIYPQEHSNLHSDLYPSYVLAGPDRHWRTISHATHTFITHGHVVRNFWRYFENTKFVGIKKKRKLGSEARTTNKLFNHIPGFSPLTPAAVHFQYEDLLPPFYDWKDLWDKNKV